MYCSPNFKSKKALKEAVEAYVANPQSAPPVTVFSPGPFPAKENGIEMLEGPHSPEPHKWYARVEVKNGIVVKLVK